jgi:hypothetical protein
MYPHPAQQKEKKKEECPLNKSKDSVFHILT